MCVEYYRLQKVSGNPEVVAENLERLNSTLDLYDVILSKQKYLAGDVSFSTI